MGFKDRIGFYWLTPYAELDIIWKYETNSILMNMDGFIVIHVCIVICYTYIVYSIP